MAVKSLVYDCETVFSVSLHCYHIDRLRKKKMAFERPNSTAVRARPQTGRGFAQFPSIPIDGRAWLTRPAPTRPRWPARTRFRAGETGVFRGADQDR